MLRGFTLRFGVFDDEQFDELGFERHLSTNRARAVPESWYWIRKLQARFFAGEYASALDAAEKARGLRWTPPHLFEVAEYEFYCALSRAAVWDSLPPGEREEHLEALRVHHRHLEDWAHNCPENFSDRAALVGAEIARLEGRDLDAQHLYERAIRSACANALVQSEALAYELAARFYAGRGFEAIARLYLREARRCYSSWGADGKVRQLDALHPHLKAAAASGPVGSIVAPVEHLDLATVLKVSQAVAGEFVLDKLIDKLMRTALEHAGAQRGLLIDSRKDGLRLEAQAVISGNDITVHRSQDPIETLALSRSMLNYVSRTHEVAIFHTGEPESPFHDDEYARAAQVRSILCLPLIRQGQVVALLYLENNLAAGVFTPARVAVLRLLASEAATALENSRLYRELQEREGKFRRLVDSNIIGVVIADQDGDILEANEAFLSMLGYNQEELAAGRLRWRDLTPAEWLPASQRAREQTQAVGRCEAFEKEYFRKDGGRVPVLVGGAAFDEARTKVISFVLDLTERKRGEEALQTARLQLVRMSRVLTTAELMSSIAHEVNQPLGSIVASVGACLRWMNATPADLDSARRTLERIAHDGERASAIISRIRALVRREPPRQEPVDLNEVILEVIALTRDQMRSNDIALSTQLAAELKPVVGDKIQLQQVMLNLIVNAIDAMSAIPDAPRQLTIVSLNDGLKGVRVEVRDVGPGIESERAEHLFEPFYTTKPQGIGMGLWISRSIIEAHAGSLWATANAPLGAVFQFSLPVEPLTPTKSAPGDRAARVELASGNGQR
jgi:PAS domain S-box-containing protein